MEFPPSHLSSSPCLPVQERVSWALLCFPFSPPRKDSGAEGLVWWERREKLWPTPWGSGIITILWWGRNRGVTWSRRGHPVALICILTWLKSAQKQIFPVLKLGGQRRGWEGWGVLVRSEKGRSQWASVEHSRYPLGILYLRSLYPTTALRRYFYSNFSNEKDDARREASTVYTAPEGGQVRTGWALGSPCLPSQELPGDT